MFQTACQATKNIIQSNNKYYSIKINIKNDQMWNEIHNKTSYNKPQNLFSEKEKSQQFEID